MNNQIVGEKIRLREKLGFTGFSISNNIVYHFKSSYYLFFLTNVLKINIIIAGTILAIGTIWDAVNDPIVGYIALNRRFKNGERCRPFALWFSVPWAATLVSLFSNFGTSEYVSAAIALAGYFVFELFNTFVGIPYSAMGSLATNVDSQRKSINVFRNLGGTLGAAIGAVSILPLLRLFGGLDEGGNLTDASSKGFFTVAIFMGFICIAGSLFHYFTTTERVVPIAKTEDKISVKAVVKMLFKSKTWVLNTVYIALYYIINVLLMTNISYYATYVVGSTGAATAITASCLVASIVTTFLVSPIDKRLGRKNTMIFGAAAFILSKVWFIINPFSLGALYVNSILTGVGFATTFVMFNTNINNIVDIIEWKDGRRIDTMVSTAGGLASKIASACATQLIAVFLSVAGFDSNAATQPDKVIGSINILLGWAPFIVGIALLIVVAFLDVEKEQKKMVAEKAAQANS
jgi:GPH family glycoside/pentoside/hexuronide:cation symporter